MRYWIRINPTAQPAENENGQHLVLVDSNQSNCKARSKRAAYCFTGLESTQLQSNPKTNSILYYWIRTNATAEPAKNGERLVLLVSSENICKAIQTWAASCLTGFKTKQPQSHIKTGSILSYWIQNNTNAKPSQNEQHLVLLDSNQHNSRPSQKRTASRVTGSKTTQPQSQPKTDSIMFHWAQMNTTPKPGQNGQHLVLLDSNQHNCRAS